MGLIFKFAFVILVHAAFFTGYPDSGKYAQYYMAVSVVLWAVFIMFTSAQIAAAKLISGLFGLILNAAVFAAMAFAIAITMPQNDKVTVLEKIKAGKYPSKQDARLGLSKLGINLDKEIDKGLNKLDGELKSAVEEIKGKK